MAKLQLSDVRMQHRLAMFATSTFQIWHSYGTGPLGVLLARDAMLVKTHTEGEWLLDLGHFTGSYCVCISYIDKVWKLVTELYNCSPNHVLIRHVEGQPIAHVRRGPQVWIWGCVTGAAGNVCPARHSQKAAIVGEKGRLDGTTARWAQNEFAYETGDVVKTFASARTTSSALLAQPSGVRFIERSD